MMAAAIAPPACRGGRNTERWKYDLSLKLFFLCNRVLLNLIEVFTKVHLHMDTLDVYILIFMLYIYITTSLFPIKLVETA